MFEVKVKLENGYEVLIPNATSVAIDGDPMYGNQLLKIAKADGGKFVATLDQVAYYESFKVDE